MGRLAHDREALQLQQGPGHRPEGSRHAQRLAAGEEVVRLYQEPGLAWLERQAEVAEELVAQWKRTAGNRPGSWRVCP